MEWYNVVKLDKKSHNGTEWLHLFILKSKISLQKNKSIYENKCLISLPQYFDRDTKVTIGNQTYTIKELHEALFYQLRERLMFVKPQDFIVAELLYTLGRIHEQTTVINEAQNIFELSIQYGFKDTALIAKRLEKYNTIIEQSNIKYIVIALLGVVFILGLNYFYLKIRDKKTIVKKETSPLYFAILVVGYLFLFLFIGSIITLLLLGLYNFQNDSSHIMWIIFIHLLIFFFYYSAILIFIKDVKKYFVIMNKQKSIFLSVGLVTVIDVYILYKIDMTIFSLIYHTGLILLLFWMLKKYLMTENENKQEPK